MAKTSTIDALKIQARAVAPIMAALEKRLGKDEAQRLVADAIAESWANFAQTRFSDREHPRGADGPFRTDRVVVTDSDTEYRMNITSCESAEYFRGIGQPEVGAVLSCGVDFAVERLRCPDWEFSRTQTLMMGANHCDFCWKKRG